MPSKTHITILIAALILMLAQGVVAQDQVAFRLLGVATGLQDIHSNVVEINRPLSIYVPNAFTPNGDGRNDQFVAVGEGFSEYRMVVYDRWGMVLFESADIGMGWDGMIGGEKAPVGVYTYEIVAYSSEFPTFQKTGTLILASNE